MERFTDFWCFRVGVLSRKIQRYYNQRYADYGITVGQSFVLFDLLDHGDSSVKDIAKRVQLDSPAVTGFIDRLSKEGYVERREDPNDRRIVQVSLTPNGRKLAECIFPIAQEYHDHLKDLLAVDEATLFDQLMRKLEAELESQ